MRLERPTSKNARIADGRPRATARARWALGLSIAATIGGICFSEPFLVQLALLGFLVLGGARYLAWQNLRGLRPERRMPTHVYARQDFPLELSLLKRSNGRGSYHVEFEDSLLPKTEAGMHCPVVRGALSERAGFFTRIIRRGPQKEMRYTLRSFFPLGLYRTSLGGVWPDRVIVFPKPVIPDALRHFLENDRSDEGNESHYKPDRDGDFRAVREFQPGDPLKLIHWPTVARTGKIMTREFDRPVPRRYTVLYHAFTPPNQLIWPEAFEHAMELLAGLLVYCKSQHIPLSLRGAFNGWEPVELYGLRDLTEPLTLLALARYRAEKDLSALNAALAEIPDGQSVFVVSSTPVELWEPRLPDTGKRLVCLDNSGMRVKPVRPRLHIDDLRTKPEGRAIVP
jgi:uncharacterized protein (DUF58 family)